MIASAGLEDPPGPLLQEKDAKQGGKRQGPCREPGEPRGARQAQTAAGSFARGRPLPSFHTPKRGISQGGKLLQSVDNSLSIVLMIFRKEQYVNYPVDSSAACRSGSRLLPPPPVSPPRCVCGVCGQEIYSRGPLCRYRATRGRREQEAAAPRAVPPTDWVGRGRVGKRGKEETAATSRCLRSCHLWSWVISRRRLQSRRRPCIQTKQQQQLTQLALPPLPPPPQPQPLAP